ncbi:MAG: tetratricopeptide repeat protein [Woeseiaceae bacterium]|nr:tetratricopeptide repeat protein [Woeseiaceae bacterium]
MRSLIHRVLGAAVIAMFVVTPVNAQETVQIAASAENRSLYRQAQELLAAGNAPAAHALLAPRQRELAGETMFDYLLGVAQLDTGRRAEAILSLRRAVAQAPAFSGARMELARALYEAGAAAEARALFVQLKAENPPPEVNAVLDRYITAIDGDPSTPPARFRPYAELFAGHDSNANGSTGESDFLGFMLNPENVETDSAFFEGAAGFDWIVPRSARFAWVFGARASYRSNPDADFVDAGIVAGGAGLHWRRGAAYGSAGIDAYRATRDGEANESYAGGRLAVGRRLSERWDLDFNVMRGALRYDDAIDVLDVDRTLAAIGLGYRFGPRARLKLEAIGGSDDERASGAPYGNSKAGARLGLAAALADAVFFSASVGSLTSDYDGLFFGARREDTQTTALVGLEFRDVLTRGLSIAPRLRYIDNESDIALYDYDRFEVGLLIRWASP